MFHLGRTSVSRLRGVDSGLIRVVIRAIQLSDCDFCVHEGLRSLDRQKRLYRSGKSMTMNSRHLVGEAVDLVPYVDGKKTWAKWSLFDEIALAMKTAAEEQGVEIEWGGDWRTFKDGPHFQIKKK